MPIKPFIQFITELTDDNPPVTDEQLQKLEKYLDYLYDAIGIDVEFTRHFIERVNDARNGKQITVAELVDIFRKSYEKHGDVMKNAKEGWEAVLFDRSSDINMPFVLKYDSRKKEMDLVVKTTMRKHSFLTRSKKLVVEEKTLWALRSSVARGKEWVAERKVSDETAQKWLEVFQKDEPAIQFTISDKKPKVK